MFLPDLSWILITLLAFLTGIAACRLWRRNVQTTTHSPRRLQLLNWRLMLVGATALVLSIASGWTTWDGMRNFTNEPILSFLITFGIQGVMLVSAWLIGDSFLQSEPFLISGVSPAEAPFSRIATVAAITLVTALLFWAAGFVIYHFLSTARVTLLSAFATISFALLFAIGIV